MSRSSVDVVFITNNRGTRQDFEAAYSRFPNWDHPDFVPPDILEWKEVRLTTNGEVINCLIIAIGSDTFDIVSGVSGFKKASGQVVMAIERAKQLGAKVICFGAGTKKLVHPTKLHSLNGTGFVYTNGDTVTAGVVCQQLLANVERLEIDLFSPSTTVALVGAYGVIGSQLTSFLSNYGCRLILVGPRKSMLEKLEVGHDNVALLTDLTQLRERVDVLIAATNHPESLVNPTQLREWGEFIFAIDVAEPANITPEVVQAMRGRLLRIDGGMVQHPGLWYDGGTQLGIKDDQAFACLAESLIVALGLRHKRFSIGGLQLMTVDSELIQPLMRLAEEFGFSISQPEAFGQPITEEKLAWWLKSHAARHLIRA